MHGVELAFELHMLTMLAFCVSEFRKADYVRRFLYLFWWLDVVFFCVIVVQALHSCVPMCPRLSGKVGIILRYHALFYLLFGLLMSDTFTVRLVVGIMNHLGVRFEVL
jgi:hypothetical protein